MNGLCLFFFFNRFGHGIVLRGQISVKKVIKRFAALNAIEIILGEVIPIPIAIGIKLSYKELYQLLSEGSETVV